MWPIIYRILFPSVFVVIFFGTTAVILCYRYLKLPEKRKPSKKAAMVFSAIALLGLFLAGYDSFDLILQDFVTQEGVYMHYYRGREVYINEIYFSTNDGSDFCYAFNMDTKDLTEGNQYKFTYGKRTRMLISVAEITA